MENLGLVVINDYKILQVVLGLCVRVVLKCSNLLQKKVHSELYGVRYVQATCAPWETVGHCTPPPTVE